MDTPRGDIIEISSSSYELSPFSSKVDSGHNVYGDVSPERSASASVGGLRPEIESGEGGTATGTPGQLKASSRRRLRGEGRGTKKRARAKLGQRGGDEPRQISLRGSAFESRDVCSTKKADKILADSEAGTSEVLPPRIRDSFLEMRYSPSTGMERSEWEVIFEQFLSMGLIVKEEVHSD